MAINCSNSPISREMKKLAIIRTFANSNHLENGGVRIIERQLYVEMRV